MSLKKLIDLDLLDRFLDKVKALIPSVATNAPQMDGTAAVGSSTKYAREDHVHPTDSSLISLGLTGTELVDGDSLGLIKTQGNYYFNGSGTIGGAPTSSKFKMVVIKTGNDINGLNIGLPCQILFANDGASSKIYYRYYWSGNLWRDWQTLSNNLSKGSRTVIPSTGANLNDYKTPGSYSFASNGSVTNSPLPESSYAFTLFVIEGNNTYGHGCSQAIFPIDATVGATFTADVYFRRYSPNASDGGWSDWVNIRNPELVNNHTVESDVPANAVFTDTTYTPASATPLMDGTAAVGTSVKYAREDHVHPKNYSMFSLDADGVSLSTNNNLDDFKTPGNYYCISTSIAEAIVNSPPDKEPFKLVVIKTGPQTSYVCQLAFTRKSDYIYYRFYKSTWSDWKTFNIEPASAAPGNVASSSSTGTSTNYARQDHTHGIDLATGDSNGQVKIAGQNVSVKGLGSLAYADSVTTVNGHTVYSDVPTNAFFKNLLEIGSSIAISDGSNLNDYKTAGRYHTSNASHGISNVPSGLTGPFSLVVADNFASGANFCHQFLFCDPLNNGRDTFFVRSYNLGTWGDWFDIRDAATVNGRSVVAALEYNVTEVKTGDDLDDYITPGTYYCQTSTIASNVSNIPEGVGAAFKLYVIGIIQNRYYQLLLFNNDAHLMFYRYYYNGSWFSWHEVDNPSKVNGHTVLSDVPANAVFTDTTYDLGDLAFEDSVSELAVNEIEANTDLNTLLTPGLYKCGTIAIGNTLTNAPAQTGFAMRVVSTTTNYNGRCQIAVTYLSGKIYHRVHYNGTWTEWQEWKFTNAANVANSLYYGECSTGASTAAKVVTLANGDDFTLVEGAKICVRFENANSASNPTLNVNGTGAIAAVRYGTTAIGTSAGSAGAWSAGGIVIFVYDGTSWVEHYWGNTTYSSMSVAEYTAGTGTTARLMTPARLKAAIKMHSAPEVYTATIPTTGWTTESYGAYIDVTFTGATFAADDTVFVDLNLSDDANLQLINDSWACLLRATPTASSAVIRFKFREIPTVAIPVRAVVT